MKTVSILLALGLLCSTVRGADLALDQTSTIKTAESNNVTPPFVPVSEPIAVQESSEKADEGTEGPVKGGPGDGKIGSGGWGGDKADGGSGGWTGDVAKGGTGGWTGDVAKGGTGGWTGDVAKGGSGGWTGDVANGGSGGGGGGVGGTGR
jgi:hypothetical protein